MSSSNNGTAEPTRGKRQLVFLGLICGLLIVGGIALNVQIGDATAQPLTLGDVSEATIVEIRDHRGVPVLSGEFRSSVDMLGNTEKDAALKNRDGRTVIGEVELEIPEPTRENRRPELEVDIIGLPPRQTFTIVIDDKAVATFVTDDRGSIDRELQEGEIPPQLPN